MRPGQVPDAGNKGPNEVLAEGLASGISNSTAGQENGKGCNSWSTRHRTLTTPRAMRLNKCFRDGKSLSAKIDEMLAAYVSDELASNNAPATAHDTPARPLIPSDTTP